MESLPLEEPRDLPFNLHYKRAEWSWEDTHNAKLSVVPWRGPGLFRRGWQGEHFEVENLGSDVAKPGSG